MFTFGIIGMAAQEEQTVTFDPCCMTRHFPWFVNLFVLYLLVVMILTVIRAVALLWALRKHRKAQKQARLLVADSRSFWDICNARTQSIRNFSHLSLLLSLLVLAWEGTNALSNVATEKVVGVRALADRFADALTDLSAGMVVCIALFCCAMFLERFVRRQKLSIEEKSGRALSEPAQRT
jgi:biopolymer transport protein ExbB/TolQ